MRYLLPALILILFVGLLYRAYATSKEPAVLLKGAGLIVLGLFFALFLCSMIVYVPLMILHLAATIVYWSGVALYLLKGRLNFWLLVPPAVTLLLFFGAAWIVGGE